MPNRDEQGIFQNISNTAESSISTILEPRGEPSSSVNQGLDFLYLQGGKPRNHQLRTLLSSWAGRARVSSVPFTSPDLGLTQDQSFGLFLASLTPQAEASHSLAGSPDFRKGLPDCPVGRVFLASQGFSNCPLSWAHLCIALALPTWGFSSAMNGKESDEKGPEEMGWASSY